MDNKKSKIKSFNKKLVIILFIILAILGTLLVKESYALRVPAEIRSEPHNPSESPLPPWEPDFPWMTYEDLRDLYDVLCCEHGRPLKGKASVHMEGTYQGTAFSYVWNSAVAGDVTLAHLTNNEIGTKIQYHRQCASSSWDFDKSTYTHYTFGYYQLEKHFIATPKEAYILAEMKKESAAGGANSTFEFRYDNDGNRIPAGSISAGSAGMTLTTGETIYHTNCVYALELPGGGAVKAQKTASGAWIAIGGYSGDFEYTNAKSGVTVHMEGATLDAGVIVYNGTSINLNGAKAHLISSDAVVQLEDGSLWYCEIHGDYNYIQIAWWTTEAGTVGVPSAGNDLSEEAEAFEAYILEAAGVTDVHSLRYAVKNYKFYDGEIYQQDSMGHYVEDGAGVYIKDGNLVSGSVTAPDFKYGSKRLYPTGTIDYEIKWNEDANQDGSVDQADAITVSWLPDEQKYLIGPYSVDYIKAMGEIEGRNPYDFASMIDATLNTNDRELKYIDENGQGDWEFQFLDGQGRTPEDENYRFPNPNEVFYIKIKYDPSFTNVFYFRLDFKHMNAGAEFDRYRGYYNIATWRKKSQSYGHGLHTDRDVWLELTALTQKPSQTLAHALKAARWYNYDYIETELNLPERSKIEIEKEIVDENGNFLKIDDKFYFNIELTIQDKDKDGNFVTRTENQAIEVDVVDGKGFATTDWIYWKKDCNPPTYVVTEIPDTNGRYSCTLQNASGSLASGSTVKVQAENKYQPYESDLKITKRLLNPIPALISENFKFKVKVTGEFSYDGGPLTNYTESNPLIIDASVTGPNTWNSGTFKWYKDAPKYVVEEVIPDDAVFEQHSIMNARGQLQDQKTAEVIVTNTANSTKIRINKDLLNPTPALVGESFNITLKLTAQPGTKFGIASGGSITKLTTKEYNITLNAGNNWTWESDEIIWGKKAPTYEAFEVISGTADYKVVSVRNENKTSLENKIEDVLDKDKVNLIVFVNTTKINPKSKLTIEKQASDSLVGKEFKFEATISGKFGYNGGPIQDQTIKLQNSPDGLLIVKGGEKFESEYVEWEAGTEAPKYSVREDFNTLKQYNENGVEVYFTSITDGKNTINSIERYIEGSFEENEGVGKDIHIVAVNTDGQSRIQIIKRTENSELDGRTFKFRVTLKGVYSYEGRDYTLKDEPLSFEVSVVAGDSTGWVSSPITWDTARIPEYSVQEIDIPEDCEFVSISNNRKTVKTTIIEDSLINGQITVTAINTTAVKKEGYLKIIKYLQSDDENTQNKAYNFNIEVTGKFGYAGGEIKDQTINLSATVTSNDQSGWLSDKFEWTNQPPKYTITEDTSGFKQGPDYWESFVSISNANQSNTKNSITGSITSGTTTNPTIVTATNHIGIIDRSGRIQIKKTYIDDNGNEIKGVPFDFTIEVTNAKGEVTTIQKTIKSGETWRSSKFYWKSNEAAPTYKVTEASVNGITATIDNPTGSLEDNEIINVNVENKAQGHKGKLKIIKTLEVVDKLADQDLKQIDANFTFKAIVKGTFTYKNKTYTNDSMTIQVIINKSTNWEWISDDITWYANGPAPEFIVMETNLPDKWKMKSLTPPTGSLQDGGTTEVECINEYDDTTINLLMDLAGKVWDDTDRSAGKHADAQENGYIEDGEPGIPNVKVNVYRTCNGQRLDSYMMNGTVYSGHYTTYTDASGNWRADNISVPAALNGEGAGNYSYDVEFEYDGQTYEPTTFLQTSGGNASAYINAGTADKDNYLLDSMAIDGTIEGTTDEKNDRNKFNESFKEITGDSPMDASGYTDGIAKGGSADKTLHYSSVDSTSIMNGDNTRKISTLQTVDDSGKIYDDLLLKASTGKGGLTFPFNIAGYNGWHLESWDKSETFLGGVTYTFRAVYNYCLSINLGLIEREATDIALEKDLTTATVVVNGKAVRYKYNRALDLSVPENQELLYKQLSVADEDIKYNLGLYASDYYYRASVYTGDIANKIDNYIKNIGVSRGLESTELEIYLTYTVRVRNESETYDVEINSIDDYYDDTLKLIDNPDDAKKYIQTMNGKEVRQAVQLADKPKVKYPDGSEADVTWTDIDSGMSGSDGATYNRIRTESLKGKKLASGEVAEITMTFRVDKSDDNGIARALKLGEKHNVIEISNFTSYYSDRSKNKWGNSGDIAGRVDEDSAPNNVNIQELNEKTYYEDDTDAAPIIDIELYDVDREITGVVWEDAQTQAISYNQVIGNGLLNPDEGDRLIPNLTTEIYETIAVEGANGEFEEYQFAWPTEEPNADLGGRTLSELTGFKQSITTNESGEYSFVSIPAGNYKVRFVYGDKKVETGNSGYSEVYNGQDYKSTAYQIGTDNTSGNFLANEWQDLLNVDLAGARVSDARDVEARRLFITAKSEMLTYDNTLLLDSADHKDADHTELFGNYDTAKVTDPVKGDGYYMYAETAKINLLVEDINKLQGEILTDPNNTSSNGVELGCIQGSITSNGVTVGTKDFSYVVRNIDCGIEERSQTKITLDKQIKEIKLTTSDGNVILDAIYDIYYEVGKNGTINSSVVLNEELSTGYENIASLNRSGPSQGYRYIMAEGVILQGTTIDVTYQISAFNVGETDRDTQKLKDLWNVVNTGTEAEAEAAIDAAITELSTNTYTYTDNIHNDRRRYNGTDLGYGTYFGKIYYLGSAGDISGDDKDDIVKTQVHQVIDYVDTDVEFIDIDNIGKNHSWANITIADLQNNHLIDPSIITANDDGNPTILNDEYQEYITDSKNNIITNIDNGEDTDNGEGTNPGFVKFTTPYSINNSFDNSKIAIDLAVSRFYSSEADASDIDNIVEIIKLENTVGRRDVRTIAGNAVPSEGAYATALKEPDSSATEVITLSPPTGDTSNNTIVIQLIITILIGTIAIAVGIVFIKKKVLIKK